MPYERPPIFNGAEWVLVSHDGGSGTIPGPDMSRLTPVSGTDVQYGAAIYGDYGYQAFIEGFYDLPAPPAWSSGVLSGAHYNRYDGTQNQRSITEGTTIVYFNPYRNEWTGEVDTQFYVDPDLGPLATLHWGVGGAGTWEGELFRRIVVSTPVVPPDPTADPCPKPDWPYGSGLAAAEGDWGSVRFRTFH